MYTLDIVLLTRENLTPKDIENMDSEEWDLYLEILKEIQKGESHKKKVEENKSKKR